MTHECYCGTCGKFYLKNDGADKTLRDEFALISFRARLEAMLCGHTDPSNVTAALVWGDADALMAARSTVLVPKTCPKCEPGPGKIIEYKDGKCVKCGREIK